MIDKKDTKLISIWLITSLIMIFIMIIVGGLTRLTDSGLSITEWELFKGIMPPLNEKVWLDYFESYKNIPQYQLINFNMSLSEFKIIFYWEYFHRILGRIIGLIFLIPLIYFHYRNKISKEFLTPLYLVLFLIILQGFIGWYMVQSGLVNDVTVSHYRLSLHLSLALLIISILFWIFLNTIKKTKKKFFLLENKNIIFLFLFLLIFSQIILGAFVSGLDAGKIYQTWPLMGTSYFPNDFSIKGLNNFFEFDNHSLVQFYHRNLAYIISLYILFLGFFIFIKKLKKLIRPYLILFIFIIFQIVLGILTLISNLHIYLASAHQISSVLLLFSALNLYYFHAK